MIKCGAKLVKKMHVRKFLGLDVHFCGSKSLLCAYFSIARAMEVAISAISSADKVIFGLENDISPSLLIGIKCICT